jgi:hypothetical protein
MMERTAFLILPDKVFEIAMSTAIRSGRTFDRDFIYFIIEAKNSLDTGDKWKTHMGMSWELSEDYAGFNVPIPLEWLLLRYLCHHIRNKTIQRLEGPNGEVLMTNNLNL